MTSWPNFALSEFACSHTGDNFIQHDFVDRLQALRTEYGKAMIITSGYRSPTHPVEARKESPGAHTTGRAADIAVMGEDALRLLELALKHGFTGVGINQKGDGRFIHLDDCAGSPQMPRPWIWSY